MTESGDEFKKDVETQGDKDISLQIGELKKKLMQMEEEAKKINKMQSEVEKEMLPALATSEEDLRSVYVGNVDYSTKPEELQREFSDCGIVNRVTILTNKFTGQPLGYAYVEFAEKNSIELACEKDGKEFRGRNLKVKPKRSNVPGIGRKGRGRRGRGRYRGRYRSRNYRGRGRGYY